MQTTIEIRLAQSDDAPEACKVLRSSIMQCCIEDHKNNDDILSAWLENKTPETVASWFSSKFNFPIVALRGEEILGVALLMQKGKIALCYVAPAARGQGIGDALLKAMEAQAAVWRLPSIHVASTASARNFYQGRGYALKEHAMSCFGIQTSVLTKKLHITATRLDYAALTRKCICGT